MRDAGLGVVALAVKGKGIDKTNKRACLPSVVSAGMGWNGGRQ